MVWVGSQALDLQRTHLLEICVRTNGTGTEPVLVSNTVAHKTNNQPTLEQLERLEQR